MTTVISVRGRDRKALLADPNFCYVGRRCAGWKGSPFGNPFRAVKAGSLKVNLQAVNYTWFRDHATVGPGTTAEHAVDLYRQWIEANDQLRARLPELRGRVLGCWCCDWRPGQPIDKPCHAIVLAQMADELVETAP